MNKNRNRTGGQDGGRARVRAAPWYMVHRSYSRHVPQRTYCTHPTRGGTRSQEGYIDLTCAITSAILTIHHPSWGVFCPAIDPPACRAGRTQAPAHNPRHTPARRLHATHRRGLMRVYVRVTTNVPAALSHPPLEPPRALHQACHSRVRGKDPCPPVAGRLMPTRLLTERAPLS